MLYTSVLACVGRTPLVVLGRQFPPPGPTVIAKLELMNPSGSMKDRSAAYIVERGIADGTISAASHLIESSSGYFGTAGEILADLDRRLDCLEAPVSTTGTILGLARRLRRPFPRLHVVAVDAAGSVIFGGSPGPRSVPGLGAGRRPELLAPAEIDEVVYVSDREAVAGCRVLAARE